MPLQPLISLKYEPLRGKRLWQKFHGRKLFYFSLCLEKVKLLCVGDTCGVGPWASLSSCEPLCWIPETNRMSWRTKEKGRFPIFNWKGLNLNRDMTLHAVWSFSVRTLCLNSVYVTKNLVPQSVLFSKLSISSTPKVRSPSDGPWRDTTERNGAGTRRGTHSSAQGRAFEGLDSCVSSQKTYFLENSPFALKMLAKYILGVASFLTSSVMQFLCNGTGCIVQFLPQQTQSSSLVYPGHVSRSQCMPNLPSPK